MPSNEAFPHLPDDWEPTRATLHAYSHGVSAIPRTHAPAHPKWWHVSLKVADDGLVTDPVQLPNGDSLRLRMDLQRHVTVIETSDGPVGEFDMTAGDTGTEFADRLIAAVTGLGLEGEYAREKFENEEVREYDPEAAETFWKALTKVHEVFDAQRNAIDGDVGTLQLGPHGFDLSFEWFGTKIETHEEDGETQEYPSQLNLGFYPAGDAYFYSNPWPFDQSLTAIELPHGAEWHTEGWQGTMLRYADLADDPEGPAKLRGYAAAVFAAAAPTLTA